MSKKDYFTGLFSGIVIALFIGSCIICGRIIIKGDNKVSSHNANVVKDVTAYVAENNDGNVNSVFEDEAFLNKALSIESIIDMYYIEEVDDKTLQDGIFDGIMASYGDPYSNYYTLEEVIELSKDTQGVYYGIGATLQMSQEYQYPTIVDITEDSPASRSNLRIGDVIVEVDGVDVYDMELTESVALIRGDLGTTVTLTVVRPSTGDEFEEAIQRQKLDTPTVGYEMLEDNIAYIYVKEFDISTVDQFKKAYDQAEADGMKGLIVDMRNNPGGALGAAVDIAGYLVPNGLIVYTEDKYGQRTEYTCNDNHELDVPLVVLVNGYTASAAEIFAGAIKDYESGTIVGVTTYGKGIVQKVIQLEDGSAVKLTVSHYYSPNGICIHKIGIEPDEVVEFDVDAYLEDNDVDNQFDRAVEILQGQID